MSSSAIRSAASNCADPCDGRATSLASNHVSQSTSAQTKPVKLAVFDSRVSDLPVLLAGLQPDVQSVVLDAERDGIEQISEVLESAAADDVTIVAPGFCGGLRIGANALTAQNLPRYEHQLRNWFPDKTSATLTLLASEVAQRNTGKTFVSQLTAMTKATVRASAKPIGKGHWLTNTANTFRPLVLNTYSATI